MLKDQPRCLGFISYSVRFGGRYSYSYSYSLLFRFLDDDQRRSHDGRFLAIRYCRVLRYAKRSATS